MPRNVLIAQSGGPSPVINSSLRGAVDACRCFPDTFGTVYAGWQGIEGALTEDLLDLTAQPEDEIALLRYTPASGAVGTSRYNLRAQRDADFARLVDVMRAHDIGYLFYTGGNGSMEACYQWADYAHGQGLDVCAVGIPKTIDNDLGDTDFHLLDHSPGYGSVARYWSAMVQNAEEENRGSSSADAVLVLQAMGRRIGYVPAAARLADPKRETPLLIYMPESNASVEQLCDQVADTVRTSRRCILVVSEGFDVDTIGERHDALGNVQFGASKSTVAQQLINLLNERRIAGAASVRGQVPGTDQRSTAAYASIVDLDEAYRLGQKAVELAAAGESGYMATLLRKPGMIYAVEYDKVPLEAVAKAERRFPAAWISPSGNDVTDAFVEYARPLVGEDAPSVPLVNGRQRFARLQPLFAEKRLATYALQDARPR